MIEEIQHLVQCAQVKLSLEKLMTCLPKTENMFKLMLILVFNSSKVKTLNFSV